MQVTLKRMITKELRQSLLLKIGTIVNRMTKEQQEKLALTPLTPLRSQVFHFPEYLSFIYITGIMRSIKQRGVCGRAFKSNSFIMK